MDPITMLTYLQAAKTGAGLLGTLLGSGGGDLRPEQEQVFQMLKERAKGIDPETLRLMRERARSSIGNEASGLMSSTMSRLRRQGTTAAKQEEVADKLMSRRLGATGEALTGIDALNEQVISNALDRLSVYASGLGPEPITGQGWSELLGQGIGGLEANLLRKDFYKKLDELLAQNNRGKYGNAPSGQIGAMGSYDYGF